MKKLVAIIACLGILLQTFNQVVIIGQYYANKDYIAKNLCENRDKPMMHCDGKCCLKKKLAKEAGNQAPSTNNQKSEQVTLFYSNTRFEIREISLPNIPNSYYSYNDLGTFSFPNSVFHPPTA